MYLPSSEYEAPFPFAPQINHKVAHEQEDLSSYEDQLLHCPMWTVQEFMQQKALQEASYEQFNRHDQATNHIQQNPYMNYTM